MVLTGNPGMTMGSEVRTPTTPEPDPEDDDPAAPEAVTAEVVAVDGGLSPVRESSLWLKRKKYGYDIHG